MQHDQKVMEMSGGRDRDSMDLQTRIDPVFDLVLFWSLVALFFVPLCLKALHVVVRKLARADQ